MLRAQLSRVNQMISTRITIDDLPDEMLELILSQMDWFDRLSLSLLSERLARLAFGKGSTTVLNIYSNIKHRQDRKGAPSINYSVEEVHQALLCSRRPYKHVILWLSPLDNPQTILEIVDRFHRSLETLRLICCRNHGVDLNWVAQLAQIGPNLSHLDITDLELAYSDNHRQQFTLEPMSNLRTLHARSHVLRAISNSPEVFVNVTSLHVHITLQNPLRDLVRKLSCRLIDLTLICDDQLSELPEGNFPCLERLHLKRFHMTGGSFRRMFEEMPNLKALTIEPMSSFELDLREFMIRYQETLQHLEVPIHFLGRDEEADFDANQGRPEHLPKTQLENLVRFCLSGGNFSKLERLVESFEFPNVSHLQLVQSNLIEHNWMQLLPMAFPNLVELDLRNAAIDTTVHFARKLTSYLPSLKRLSIDQLCDVVHLATFLEFCGSLTVRELSVGLDFLKNGGAFALEPFQQVPSIRSLSIRAPWIDSFAYLPMMEALPELTRLELELDKICPDNVVQTILARFPRCDVVRKHYKSNYE